MAHGPRVKVNMNIRKIKQNLFIVSYSLSKKVRRKLLNAHIFAPTRTTPLATRKIRAMVNRCTLSNQTRIKSKWSS